MGAAKASEQGQVGLGGGRVISGDPWRAEREREVVAVIR